MSVPLDHNPASMLKPSSLKRLALLIAVNCVRSTVIEDDHAAGKLDDPEMKAFNLEVANNRAIVEQQPADLRAVQAAPRAGDYLRLATQECWSFRELRARLPTPSSANDSRPAKTRNSVARTAPGASDIFDPVASSVPCARVDPRGRRRQENLGVRGRGCRCGEEGAPLDFTGSLLAAHSENGPRIENPHQVAGRSDEALPP